MRYFYIRVSDPKQNIARQIESISKYDILEENIYIDKKSGKNFEREAYQELRKKVQAGDCIYFHELDRFSRNYEEGRKELEYFHNKGVQTIFLDMQHLQPAQETEDVIMKAFYHGQVIMRLAMAEEERRRIAKRREEGIKAYVAKGGKLGRRAVYKDEKLDRIVQDYLNGASP
ncbi:recombinase family protein, partial [Priestia megaterium]|uniref:recombinase family protein n=1 Tax=Priestia megaterium TaxID=1404 RepID=UPI0030C94EFB